ncbi:hypothetical protein TrRE_jg8176, partial [Triparma retinervis]
MSRSLSPLVLTETLRYNQILLIPLGPAAERMMINFGDGLSPSPSCVIEVLRQTRSFLHLAIKDARSMYAK